MIDMPLKQSKPNKTTLVSYFIPNPVYTHTEYMICEHI